MKTIVVTGASKGIGAAISRKLIERGHRVIGVARNGPALSSLQTSFKSDNFVPIVGDVCLDDTLERTLKAANGVSGLILNAGATQPILSIAEADIDEFQQYHLHL